MYVLTVEIKTAFCLRRYKFKRGRLKARKIHVAAEVVVRKVWFWKPVTRVCAFYITTKDTLEDDRK